MLFFLVAVSAIGQESNVHGDVDFAKQIVPLFTNAGCNAGACHGAAAGRGYLPLSLYGARPTDDYEALLFSISGRYVDTQQPISSLIVQKPGGYLEHTGGVRIEPDSEAFALLTSWIRGGAPRGSLTDLKALAVLPANTFDCRVGTPVHLTAVAKWDDGDQRPVTEWLVVEGAQHKDSNGTPVSYEQINAPNSSPVLELTPHLPGYWPVTLRFGATVQTVQLWVRSADIQPAAVGNQQAVTVPTNPIDQFVLTGNRRVGHDLAAACEPHILARRFWIDLLGRHPTQSEWLQASQAIDQGGAADVVERLLASSEFSQRAGKLIADWVAGASTGDRPAPLLASAISDAIEESDNLQLLAEEMLLVSDSSNELNAFHHFANDPRTRAELVASVWMGVRVGCAQCHDHPLDHWTQDDYFSMAACWSEIEPAGRGAKRISQRTTTDLRTGRAAVARLPGELVAYTAEDTPADVAFTAWMCSADNPQFAANIANRVWYWLLGVGLVEEVDDHRSTNPAINPELLEHLSKTLVDSGYSLRSLVREIVLSDAYGRSSGAESSRLEQRLAAVRIPKTITISLDQLVGHALELQPTGNGNADGEDSSMSMMVVQNESGCKRGQVCSDPLGESLELAAGKALNDLLGKAVTRGLVQREPMELLDDFYQRLFGVSADAMQRDRWSSLLADSQSGDQAVVEDLLWSWVVSDDFRLLR